MIKCFLAAATTLFFFIIAFNACNKHNFRDLENVNYSVKPEEPGIGGKYVPSKTSMDSDFKILVIFAQLKDDRKDSENNIWPVNSMPVWAYDFIGTDRDDAPFKPLSLSNYFYEMSYGQYIITGYIYPEVVIVNLPLNTGYSHANAKILETVDKEIDFRKFDKWNTKITNRNNTNEPDNHVDGVYIIYRNLPNETWGGIAMLGTNYNTKDGPIVSSRIPTVSMTVNVGKKGDYSYENKIILLAHEFGHYLLGESHNFEPEFGGKGDRQRGIGLMPGDAGTSAMNPQEKYLLGYINFVDVFENMEGTLPDFQQTGKAYRIPIPLQINGNPNTNPNEYFIVANHQKLSQYENTKGKGIFIYHVKNKPYGHNHIDLVCADGLWQWKAVKWLKRPEGIGGPVDWVVQNGRNAPFSEKMPVIIHDYVDRINGRDELQEILLAKNEDKGTKTYWWDKWIDENGNVIEDPHGDKEDAFNIGYNELFSPWSNPASLDKTRKPTYVSVWLKEKNDGVFKLQFYVDSLSSLKAPPAKPQNLRYSINTSNSVTLSWEPNIEPDMINGGRYKIYRAVSSSGNGISDQYIEIGIVKATPKNKSIISWTDKSIELNKNYLYKISAVDNTFLESVKSDSVDISK